MRLTKPQTRERLAAVLERWITSGTEPASRGARCSAQCRIE
jgi:hypothetical protein